MLYRHLTTYRWSIALVTVVAAGSALFFSLQATRVYEASTTVLVEAIVPVSDREGFVPPPSLATEARLASSLPVAELVAARLRSTEDPAELLDHLTVETVPETTLLVFRYEAEDAAAAAGGAGTFAEQYLRSRERQVAEDVVATIAAMEKDISQIEKELDRLSEEIAAASDEDIQSLLRSRADLLSGLVVEKQLAVLRLRGDLESGQIVQGAQPPTEPIRPNHRLNTMLGVVLGLLLGAGQAVLRGRLSRGVWSIDELEAVTGAPLFGAIPPSRARSRRRAASLLSEPRTPGAIVEAFRFVRENVTAAVPRERGNVLVVTSAEPGEAKSIVAVNLAMSLTRAGKRAILVSGDDRGTVDALLGLTGRRGLVDAFSEEISVRDVLVTHPSGVLVLPYGRRNDAPMELIRPGSLDLLRDIARGADLLLIDSPAMADSADTVSFAPAADGVVLVVDAERADPGQLRFARRQLDQARLPLLGCVLSGADLGELEARSFRHAVEVGGFPHPRGKSSDVTSSSGRPR